MKSRVPTQQWVGAYFLRGETIVTGYQIREMGKSAGNVWNEKKGPTCAEWAESPEGKEVATIENGEERIIPQEESRREANKYNMLRH
jgi:hypothetical protein